MPHLEAGDIIIDGGNSEFSDSNRRSKALAEKGILFIGTGLFELFVQALKPLQSLALTRAPIPSTPLPQACLVARRVRAMARPSCPAATPRPGL